MYSHGALEGMPLATESSWSSIWYYMSGSGFFGASLSLNALAPDLFFPIVLI